MNQTARRLFWGRLIITLLFFTGSLIGLYPFYVNGINNFLDERRLAAVQKKLAQEQAQLAKKRAENRQQAKNFAPHTVPFDENGKGSKDEAYYLAHLLGRIQIPKIKIDIPLYDQTDQHLLNNGATWVAGTSFPAGGVGAHTLLSAHSGLPGRKLFTDLEELAKGDEFVLEVYGEKLAYQVVDIQIVLPEETQRLQLDPDRDLATLLTCTPYMVNTHRLLVTGERIPYTEKLAGAVKKSQQVRRQVDLVILAITAGIILLGLFLLYRSVKYFFLMRRRRDLVFYRLDHAFHGVPGATYQLYRRKKPLQRNGRPLLAVADPKGKVCFDDLPGGSYLLRELQPEPTIQVKVAIKKWRQSEFAFYPKRGQTTVRKNKMIIQSMLK